MGSYAWNDRTMAFCCFQENALKELGQFMADAYKASTSNSTFLQKKYDKFLNRPSLSSVVIAIC